jgi:hypothetical protein
MLSDELCVASELRIPTVWILQDVFEGTVPEGAPCVPDYTVRSIQELRALLTKI